MNATEARRLQRPHVFAINSSPDFLDILRQLFQEEDYNVTTTNFMPDTFDQIAAVEPDVVIADLVPGEQAGYELLEQLAESASTARVPVLVVSTSVDLLEATQAHPERFGRNQYLSKPLDLDELVRAVDTLAGQV